MLFGRISPSFSLSTFLQQRKRLNLFSSSYSSSSFVIPTRSPRTTTTMIPGNDSCPHRLGDVQGNFKLLQSFVLPYAPHMQVQKWKSVKTGLTLVWANFQSPLLNAYLTVPTEIFNDSGVPHTLEHLIFLGSHKYPYKGLLDSLANRAFANGTNAWTATDHTAYELTTASSDGFLRMLPIYADHLFSATMTDAGFVTEVYHINGKGQDAGVVFSEMQGRENTSADLIAGRIQKSLYRSGNAYRSDTGGLMGMLRVLTVEEIRSYHATYYAPHNVALVVAGPLPSDELITVVNGIDDDLINSGKVSGPSGPIGWSRPFMATPSATAPIIDGTEAGDHPSLFPVDDPSARDRLRRKNTIEFPEDDESTGEVYLTWMGTKWGEWLDEAALSVLETYLTDSAVSPLQKALVERDDPLCTDISFSSETQAGRGTISAYFSSVPTPKLNDLDLELIELLNGIVKEGIDMKRMQMCIKRDQVKELNQLEVRTAEYLADSLIIDHLYGKEDGGDLYTGMDAMARYSQLQDWTSEQWTHLLTKYYINNPRLVVVGKPSKALAKRLKNDTKELERKRKADLGEDGLKKYAEKVEKARKINDQPIPDKLLDDFKIPSKESINWIESGQALVGQRPQTPGEVTASATTLLDEQLQAHLRKNGGDSAAFPFPIQFAQVSSAFVRITLVFPTTDMPGHLRPLIELYLETFFSLPIRRNGTDLVPYEEVIKGLDNDTVDYDTRLGIGTGFAENVSITLKVEKEKYRKAVDWLRDLVWNSIFLPERLRISAAKTTQTLPELKRDGSSLSWALSRLQTHDLDKSTNAATSILSILTHMPLLTKDLTENPDKVVKELEQIRKSIFRPDNLVIGVTGDVCGVAEPLSAWLSFVPSSTESKVADGFAEGAVHVPWTSEVLTPLARSPARKGLICPLPTIESSYSVFTGKGILGYNQPDSAALTVAIAILNACEGPFWRCIRGAGLAYGAGIRASAEAGLLQFTLYRSPDSSKAFVEARKVVNTLLDDVNPSAEPGLSLDQSSLEAAKSLLHYSAAESESNPSQTAGEVFVDEVIKCVGRGNGRRALEAISKVTLDDVKRALKVYILPLFDPTTSICAIVSSPGRVGEIENALREIGYEMERREIDVGKDDGAEDDVQSGSQSGSEDESESGSGSESESSGEDEEERSVDSKR